MCFCLNHRHRRAASYRASGLVPWPTAVQSGLVCFQYFPGVAVKELAFSEAARATGQRKIKRSVKANAFLPTAC